MRKNYLYFCLILLMLGFAKEGFGQIVSFSFYGWPGGNNNFGPSPDAPTFSNPNVTIVGLTRGPGIGTNQTAAENAWGGTGFNTSAASEAAAISDGDYATFTITANTGCSISLSGIDAYNIRHSPTGPTTGIWQYEVGGGGFIDIATAITWGANTGAPGNPQSSINLSGIPALQNVSAGTTITFRIVTSGATNTAGTWYFNDPSDTSPLVVNGTLSCSPPIVSAIIPGSSLICYNTDLGTFSLTTSGGNPPYCYQWYNNGSAVSGSTNATYDPGNLTANSTIYCQVFNSGCVSGVPTPTATISVNPTAVPPPTPVTANGISGSVSICSGGSVTLNAVSAGNTINWYKGSTYLGNVGSGVGYVVSNVTGNTTFYARGRRQQLFL